MSIAAQVLLVGHLNHIQTNLEFELLFFLKVIDDRAIPDLGKVPTTYEKVRSQLMCDICILQFAIDLVSDHLGCFLNDFQVFVLDATVF